MFCGVRGPFSAAELPVLPPGVVQCDMNAGGVETGEPVSTFLCKHLMIMQKVGHAAG